MKLTSLIDENGVMTLINVREDNRVQTYFRKPMLFVYFKNNHLQHLF